MQIETREYINQNSTIFDLGREAGNGIPQTEWGDEVCLWIRPFSRFYETSLALSVNDYPIDLTPKEAMQLGQKLQEFSTQAVNNNGRASNER